MPMISDPTKNFSFLPASAGGSGGLQNQSPQGGGDMKRKMLAQALMRRGGGGQGGPYGAANAVSDIGSSVLNGMMMKKMMG